MILQGLLSIVVVSNVLAAEALRVPAGFVLVAHRGVVEPGIPENSLASLEETIRRGYTHIEVDVRCTSDGHPICLHDPGLGRAIKGAKGYVQEMTLEELRRLAPEELVPAFETFCARCEGRIGVMPDIKGCPPHLQEPYKGRLLQSMKNHGLLQNAYFIGEAALVTDGAEGGRIPWRDGDGKLGPDAVGRRFVFCHAKDIDAAGVKCFQEQGLKVIVSINTYHYWKTGAAGGRTDIQNMMAWGVDGLQIDSAYDDLLLARPAP